MFVFLSLSVCQSAWQFICVYLQVYLWECMSSIQLACIYVCISTSFFRSLSLFICLLIFVSDWSLLIPNDLRDGIYVCMTFSLPAYLRVCLLVRMHVRLPFHWLFVCLSVFLCTDIMITFHTDDMMVEIVPFTLKNENHKYFMWLNWYGTVIIYGYER